jgi:serine/threonine protein kinase
MIVENPDNSILVKLIDFGLATQLENQFHSLFLKNCGTLLFMAPELVEKKSYNWVNRINLKF